MRMLRNRYGSDRWASRTTALSVLCCVVFVCCAPASSQEEEFAGQPLEPTPELSPETPGGEPGDRPEPTSSGPIKPLEATPFAPARQDALSEDEHEPGQPPLWLEEKAEAKQESLGNAEAPEGGLDLLGLRGEGEAPELDILDAVKRMAVALLLVIAMFCVAVWLYKRLTRGRPLFPDQKGARVISRIYLNPKAVLYLVKVADRILVIGANPTTISLITEIADPDLVKELEQKQPESAATRAPFAGYLRQFRGRFSGVQQAAEEEAKLEEHLRDIKDQMARLKTLIGGSDEEER